MFLKSLVQSISVFKTVERILCLGKMINFNLMGRWLIQLVKKLSSLNQEEKG